MVQWKGLRSVCCGESVCLEDASITRLFCRRFVPLSVCTVTQTPFVFFLGIVNMSFPLSDQPVFGEWLIFVEVQGHTYNKSFEVQKYGEALESQDSLKVQFIKSFVTFFLIKVNLSFCSLLSQQKKNCLIRASEMLVFPP